MKSIKWGVLGTAGIAKSCTIPGMKEAAGCELYAIAGRDEEKVKQYQKEFGFEQAYVGYESLLADPQVQAVYIPLPNSLHHPWVLTALMAGKHVLCEKPIALNAEQAKEMYRVAEENHVVLMEAYAYLHTPYIASLKKDLAAGLIGDVDYIETSFLTQGYTDNIRINKELGGGSLYDVGCYCTTMMETLLESKPVSIHACAEFDEHNIDLSTVATLRFENGVRGAFHAGMFLGENTDFRYDNLYIHGTRGHLRSAVEYNQAGDLQYTIVSEGKEIIRTVPTRHNYALEVEQMNRILTEGEEPHITPEFSINNMMVMDEILDKIGYLK